MSDLWVEGIPEGYVRLVCEVMKATPWHTYQVLTKRSERMRDLLNAEPFKQYASLENVWWGVSVEDRKYGLPRIDHLRDNNTSHKI